MKPLARGYSEVRRLLQVHIDIPTIIFAGLVLLFVHRPLAAGLYDFVGWADTQIISPNWVKSVLLGLLANIVTAAIVMPLIVWILRIRRKAAAVGTFRAFDTSTEKEEPWGEIQLTYNLFSNRIKGSLIKDDVVVNVEAAFDRGQYLRGHYVDNSNAARRRLGAFLLMLTGEADGYSGPYVYVDPDDENMIPKTGTVRWERI